MKKNICIIDDQWPAEHYPEFIDETKKIEESILKYLYFNHNGWPEEELRNLTKEIIDNHGDWTISAFKNPQLYFNHIEDEIFSPDIIVFDWDYGVPFDSKEALLKILESTYSIVAIYTGADKGNEVTDVVNGTEFESYKDRLQIINKGQEGAVQLVIDYCNQKFEENFSHKFGQELKYNAIKSLDEILISISKLTENEFICAFGHRKEGNETEISMEEFVEIISEKFKNYLTNVDFSENKLQPVNCAQENGNDLVRKLWSYRMYYSPKDDLVRTGDIIYLTNSDEHQRFLVISANCHLREFWKKNFGNLALIPLYEKSNENTILKNKLSLFKPLGDYRKASATSVSNKWLNEAVSIVAAIPVSGEGGETQYKDYIVFPKEIITINIPPPIEVNEKTMGDIRNMRLEYVHSDILCSKNRVNINEPFRTPLIQFALNNITGYGAPDYPGSLQDSFKSLNPL